MFSQPGCLNPSLGMDTAKGRYDRAGNGATRSRIWKENRLGNPSPPMMPGPAPASLVDPQGRTLDYLRLSVTDRCNLRCRYCMPTAGPTPAARHEIMSLEEMERLANLFVRCGVRKIRITGGEPLVRRGVVPFMIRLAGLPARPEVLVTTNGLALVEHLDELARGGIRRINLSLDSLDATTWSRITRRQGHGRVVQAIDAVVTAGLGLKINMVVLPGINDHEIPDFVALTRSLPVTVRFIEPMPFAGDGKRLAKIISGEEILGRLRGRFELLPVVQDKAAVDRLFTVPGYRGRVGVISGHSRTFCAACSRLRIDSRGRLRTCLYGAPGANLLELMRGGGTNEQLVATMRAAIGARFADGQAAERAHQLVGRESMADIGG